MNHGDFQWLENWCRNYVKGCFQWLYEIWTLCVLFRPIFKHHGTSAAKVGAKRSPGLIYPTVVRLKNTHSLCTDNSGNFKPYICISYGLIRSLGNIVLHCQYCWTMSTDIPNSRAQNFVFSSTLLSCWNLEQFIWNSMWRRERGCVFFKNVHQIYGVEIFKFGFRYFWGSCTMIICPHFSDF